ncbi:Cobyric acid synthase [Dietzia timorensis]|uniref:Cobyric acid synthase n=2 Tax=Dietzia timorensis TaxID=499555 RepID=A0A173LLT1_9ACTN|nr:cobyric acid synthase [Dietzia timorensis]ANI92609.1 Cobyric acid synthase [Dietzia timorensis]
MPAPAILIAGTTSDAGKSMVVAGLCRALARRGISVAPFKAQNMSNNSAVTADGGEIGRAQALQAEACGLAPNTLFNPVLLKPGSDRRSQVVVRGKVSGSISAADYHERRAHLRTVVTDALDELRATFDIVLCEGAGSAAEVNLRDSDIANMGLAESANLPVLIVGDIDRGGVLAHFLGTLAALEAEDQSRVAGFIVNKFRGELSLLKPGLDWVEKSTGRGVLGVIPFLTDLWIDTEDGLGITPGATVGRPRAPEGKRWLDVAAIRLPRLSNSTDVEALAMEPGVRVRWVDSPSEVATADLVVLPGSKSTVSDLEWLRARGIDAGIEEARRAGAVIVGICGGFQMLSRHIDDVVEARGAQGPVPGLDLLPVDIKFAPEKTVRTIDAAGTIFGSEVRVRGYEIHHGQVQRNDAAAFHAIDGRGEGACVGRVFGSHIHGLFANDEWRREFLREAVMPQVPGFCVAADTQVEAERMRQVDVMADAVEAALDLDRIVQMASAAARFGPTLRIDRDAQSTG